MRKASRHTKTRQTHHEKRTLKANIPPEHGYKNLQNSIRKLNPALSVIHHTKTGLSHKYNVSLAFEIFAKDMSTEAFISRIYKQPSKLN